MPGRGMSSAGPAPLGTIAGGDEEVERVWRRALVLAVLAAGWAVPAGAAGRLPQQGGRVQRRGIVDAKATPIGRPISDNLPARHVELSECHLDLRRAPAALVVDRGRRRRRQRSDGQLCGIDAVDLPVVNLNDHVARHQAGPRRRAARVNLSHYHPAVVAIVQPAPHVEAYA